MITKITSAFTPVETNKHYDAAVLLAITQETHPKILLCRRANHLNSHAGEVALPGGKREPDDVDNIATALRETHEETGIPPSNVTVIGELPYPKSKAGLTVKPIIGIVPTDIVLVPEKNEVDRLFWVDIRLFKSENIQPYKISYKGLPIRTPCFMFEDEIIWGLTGRIVVSFVNQVSHDNIKWSNILWSV